MISHKQYEYQRLGLIFSAIALFLIEWVRNSQNINLCDGTLDGCLSYSWQVYQQDMGKSAIPFRSFLFSTPVYIYALILALFSLIHAWRFATTARTFYQQKHKLSKVFFERSDDPFAGLRSDAEAMLEKQLSALTKNSQKLIERYLFEWLLPSVIFSLIFIAAWLRAPMLVMLILYVVAFVVMLFMNPLACVPAESTKWNFIQERRFKELIYALYVTVALALLGWIYILTLQSYSLNDGCIALTACWRNYAPGIIENMSFTGVENLILLDTINLLIIISTIASAAFLSHTFKAYLNISYFIWHQRFLWLWICALLIVIASRLYVRNGILLATILNVSELLLMFQLAMLWYGSLQIKARDSITQRHAK